MMRINFDTLRRAWKKSYPRKVALASGVVVVGAAGLAALESRSGSIAEPDKAACCSSAVAVGDAMISPAIGADKDFFEVPSSPPSTFFLLGNNESMQDFPDGHWLPEAFTDGYYKVPPVPAEGDAGYKGDKGYFFNTGCSDPKLVEAMKWFDKDSTDVNKNGSVVYDADADMTSQFFKPSDFYHVRGRRIAWQKNNFPYSLVSPIFTQLESTSTIETACLQVWNRDSGYYKKAMHNECVQCLTTVGWWRGPLADGSTTGGSLGPARSKDEPELPPEAMRKWVVSGRILNLHPPKFVVARKVLKDVINSASNVRMGVATFGPDRGWFDPPTILKNMRPSCDLSFPTIDEEALDRPSLMKAVNATKFDNKERSIGEALFGLGGYYSSQPTKKTWEKWFVQPIGNMNWGWPGQPNGGTLDNDFGINQSGGGYGKTADEWLKGDYIDPVTGILYPGMRWEIGGKDKSVCFGCQVSSVIVLTDGAPKYDNSVPITKMMSLLTQWKAKHVATNNKSLVTFNPVDPRSNPSADPGGVNYCDLFEKAPGVKATKADCDYVDYNWPVGQLAGNKNFMDDVSFFLGQADLRDDFEGVQSMRTYTVGYGDNSPMLQSIAMAGKGKFYRANDPQQLRQALLDALGDIKQVSTSFASANISGVQTGGMQSSTFVPRFVPRRGRPYEGHLYRFFYFSEFAQGCQPMKPGSTVKDAFDLNKDGDCDDTFYLDKPAGFTTGVPNIASFTAANIVQENSEGIWVKLNTANITNGQVEGGTPAEPFWDVGKTIGERKAGKECDFANPLAPNSGRCIFTLIDKNNDGKFTAEDNPPIEFHEKNLTQLKSYLLAGGQSFCSTLFAKMLKGTWTGSDADKDECALQLVRFVRGLDVFDYDGDSIRNEERPCADNADPTDPTSCKLADIFHSTPVTVEPPVDPFLCSLGLSGQCVSTLYEDFSYSVSSEQLCASGTSTKPCYKPTPMSTPPNPSGKRNGVYDEYVKDPTLSKRDRIALVGSNGGMVHALHVGKATQTKTGALDSVYDVGTGQELWAFVPPDLLPKLGLMVGNHEYFVDGTPMVRDLWADGAPGGTPTANGRDGTKQLNEFRTIAVIGERSGGQRYMALDMTDPYLMLKAAQDQDSTDLKPFRWMFPNACDKESLSMGQSWSNFAPKPPPIGPVRLKASASAPATDRDRGWEERWVAVLNGGYSPDLTRGRGVYMVDAWTGEKLWSAEAQPGTTSGGYADVLNKMQPVVASAALVDIGKGTGLQRDLDGFFDTMIVGDMGGQVWTFRFNAPGEVDGATGVVQNWFGARSLEVQREDGSANSHQKAPFFHVAATVLQPDTGWLRSFMGTGDRQHLRTTPGADCSADDLLACIRLKCNVKASFAGEVNGQKRTSLIEYKGGVLTSNAETWNNTGGAACSGSKMELTELALSCPSTAYGTGIFPDGGGTRVYTTESHCSVVNGAWSCVRAPLNTSENQDQGLDAGEKLTVGTNRYFGFHSYGGTKRIFTDAAGAIAFDKLRVTDKQNVTCEGTNCSLVDVTIPPEYYSTMTDANGVAQRFISNVNLAKMKRGGSEDPGWFIRYTNTLAERTATGSTVLAGVVFWSSFSPNTTPGADACSLSGMGDMSYSWQADAISGLPDQASGFQLTGATPGWIASRARPTGAPPSEPAPVIAMSATGGIRYEVAISSAGSAPTTETLNSRRNTTPDISWMEVPRNLHECRHENAEACGDEAVATP
jgi:type IV pilus assembly protein PilY1